MQPDVPTDMQALVLHSPGDIRLETRPVPLPGKDEVLLRVAAAGVCGSDIPRIFTTGAHTHPLVPGHEFAGVVAGVGSNVDRVMLGLRAAVIPLMPCRRCHYCQTGEFALCDEYDYLGSRSDGGFAEYCTIPAASLVPVPDGLSLDEAALTEPAAVALHGLRRAGSVAGLSVAVFGAGPVGSFLAQFAAAEGAVQLVVVDVVEEKLKLMAGIISCTTVVAGAEDPLEVIRRLTNGLGVDLAVEAVGMESVFLDALSAARKQGKVLMIGNPGSDYGLPKALASSILRHELTILGTWNSHFAQQDGSDWVDVLRAFSLGKVGAAPLISHRVPLEGGVEALEMMRDGKEFFQKVLMIPGRDS